MSLDFLFSAALWALPLAGLPIILHLLFRRKSPVVMFSTIRFLKLSVQQTAARKKVQRWLLLACRAVLLALLVAAVAQPRTRPNALWSANPQSLAAAIVVDTSYSMQLRSGGQTLLSKANSMIQELLAGQLHDANVAIFRSSPANPNDAEQKVLLEQERGGVGSHLTWTPLAPQPASQPLVDRIPAALDSLRKSQAADQRLIVISDFQKREFPRILPEFEKARALLIDLHPPDPRSDGITRISTDPARPTPGIGSEVIVEVAGKPSTEPLVGLTIARQDGQELFQAAPQGAKIDSSGYGRIRFPVRLPEEHWLVLKAALQNEDDMPWDNTRDALIEIPPKQVVTLLPSPDFLAAERFLRLALDPNEGTSKAWPVIVKTGPTISPDSAAAVAIFGAWPDQATANQWLSFVRNGGSLICFLRPGLQTSWSKLPDAQRSALAALLPAEPIGDATEVPSSAGIATVNDPLLVGLTDSRFQLGSIVAQRYVPFALAQQSGQMLLKLFPLNPGPGASGYGLLFRRSVGAGTVFTFATIPDDQFTNLATHPIFLPLLVRMVLKESNEQNSLNVELGRPITAGGQALASISELWVHTPGNAVYPAQAINDSGSRRFVFDHADAPGLYTWTRPNDLTPVTFSNVQPPSAESLLMCCDPRALAPPGGNVVVATSLDELRGKIAAMSEPNPRWAIPIAIVMVLLCFEALMGAASGMWKLSFRRAAAA